MADIPPGLPVFSSYDVTIPKHKEELKRLDALPKQNLRKNRVINQMVEFPAGDWLTFDPDGTEETKRKQAEDLKDFFSGMLQAEIDAGVIRKDQIVAAVVHLDEVHDYVDSETGEKVQSRPHMHVMIFPTESDGHLNHRDFSNRTRIMMSNQAANKFCMENYGKKYETGSKRKSKKSVQKLKRESAEKAAEAAAKEVDALSVVVEELREKEREQRERVKALREEADAREELKAILDDYNNRQYDMTSCVILNTKIIREYLPEIQYFDKTQTVNNIKFLGFKDYGIYARHIYTSTYLDEKQKKEKEKKRKQPKWYRVLKWKIFCKMQHPKLMKYAETHNNVLSKFYMFFVFDAWYGGFRRWFELIGGKLNRKKRAK